MGAKINLSGPTPAQSQPLANMQRKKSSISPVLQLRCHTNVPYFDCCCLASICSDRRSSQSERGAGDRNV
jgi:hypothetical protein